MPPVVIETSFALLFGQHLPRKVFNRDDAGIDHPQDIQDKPYILMLLSYPSCISLLERIRST
jgi:hypothetical protein